MSPEVKKAVGLSVDISPYVLPPSRKDRSGGGGGGGSHDPRPATKGALPKFAKTQIAPPTVLPMEQPKLAVTPTVVVPPEIKLPQTGQMGDPLSKVIGSAPRTAPAWAAESAAAQVAEWDRAPAPEWVPATAAASAAEPTTWAAGCSPRRSSTGSSLSSAKRHARTSGRAWSSCGSIIGTDGKPHDITVQRSLGMGLDEKAMEAVKQWRFEPGTKDGQPVPVEVSMEVSFRLY